MKCQLKIGDHLYRYVGIGKIFDFECIGFHQYKDNCFYHMKCLNCSDHDPCEILVGFDLYGKRFNFIDSLNNRGKDYDEDDQRHWHSGDERFYQSKEDCILNYLGNVREDRLKNIETIKKRLKDEENNLKRLDGEIERHQIIKNEKMEKK